MIVQCEHCQTKYRIADEKVKGKGVKVRCAKCENVFTVAPPENDILAQSASPPPAEGPPPPTSQDKPVPDLADAGTESSPDLPPLPPLDGPGVSPEPGQKPQSEGAAPSEETPGGHGLPSLDESSADLAAQRPAHEMDQEGLTSPPPSTDEYPEDGGFEIEGTMRDEPQAGTDPFVGDGSEGIAAASEDQGPDAGWGDIAIGGDAASESAEDEFDLAGSPSYEPPPPVPMDEPAPDAMAGPLDDSVPETSSIPSYQPETRTSGRGKKGLVFLLLLVALGAGGYFAYPKVMEIIQSRGQQTEGTLTPADIQVKALTRTDGKIIYLVRGEVQNESAGNVGMIQVEAQFRNASGDVLSKATSYCGNLFEDSELVRMDMNRIRSDLQNELGQSLINASITPGQTVPFLVVLDSPPAGVSKVTVTILSFKETT